MADIIIHLFKPKHVAPTLNFQASWLKELNGLLDRGVFEIVDNTPVSIWIFGTQFVDQVKNKGIEKAFDKSHLVVQAYNNLDKKHILTQALTIQRASQRLILTLPMILPDLSIHLQDISQAYTQSTSKLVRDVFIQAPTEMQLAPGTVLCVILPLYSIPESGTHWFWTYHTHHTQKLKMIPSTFDNCLLFNKDMTVIIGLQIDDTLIAATPGFMEIELKELNSASLLAKPCKKLTTEHPLEFNGFAITLRNIETIIDQAKQIKKIQLLSKSFTKEQYIAQQAWGAYIATVSQPQAAFALSYAAQITNPTFDDAQFLNRCLSWQQKGKGLKFVNLNLETLQIVAFTNLSFANNRDHSLQIGYMIVLADLQNNANIIHWQSVKCRHVTRSILASELYTLSLGFNIAATIKSTLDQIFSSSTYGKVPLSICIDSKSLYNCLVKLGTTQEKRLTVDLLCLRQSYKRQEITKILWIKGDKNPADAMTKEKACNALQKLVDTN